jgi:hypothetical protein
MMFLASIVQIKEAARLQGFAEEDWDLWGLVYQKEAVVWKEFEEDDIVITSLTELLQRAQSIHRVQEEVLDELIYIVQVQEDGVQAIVLSQEQIHAYNKSKLN